MLSRMSRADALANLATHRRVMADNPRPPDVREAWGEFVYQFAKSLGIVRLCDWLARKLARFDRP